MYLKSYGSVLLLCAVISSPTAYGQSSDWYVAPSVVYSDDDGDRNIDDGVFGGQVTFGWNWTDHVSLEGLLGYHDIPGYKDSSQSLPGESHLELSANLLGYFDRESRFAPYGLLGVGMLRADNEATGAESRPTASFGAGFNWRIGDGSWSVRSEVRGRFVWDDCSAGCNNLTDYTVALGVQYDFGRRSSMAAPEGPQDSDRDGVLDMWDECPDTPLGTQVSSSGCPLLDREGDDDGDRIANNRDECPNTPPGVAVNPAGCSLDSDMDGVPADQDRCPSSRPGAEVDIYGCANDDDSDGVVNQRDRCPNTQRGVRVDIYGCEISDVIQLTGINFETGSDVLLPGTEHIIQDAAATLNQYPELRIEVAGHSDNIGGGLANFNLSERRAKTVRDFLIRYGVDENRITAVGYGESQPIATNETPEGRAQNRRVELRIFE